MRAPTYSFNQAIRALDTLAPIIIDRSRAEYMDATSAEELLILARVVANVDYSALGPEQVAALHSELRDAARTTLDSIDANRANSW